MEAKKGKKKGKGNEEDIDSYAEKQAARMEKIQGKSSLKEEIKVQQSAKGQTKKDKNKAKKK